MGLLGRFWGYTPLLRQQKTRAVLVTDVCIKAIDEGVELEFERQDLVDLLAFAKTERDRLEAEHEAARLAAKTEEARSKAQELAATQEKLTAHLAENKARYEALPKPLMLGDDALE